MSTSATGTKLTQEGCLQRQRRLRERLAERQLDAALLTNRSHVLYFTNHWDRTILAQSVLIPVEGPVILSTPTGGKDHLVADQVESYPADQLCTLNDDQPAQSLKPLLKPLSHYKRIGCDDASRPWMLTSSELVDLNDALYGLRRHKDADEIAVIRQAVAGCEAAYAAARQYLEPGISEIDLFARMQATAVETVGEPIGELGNDFQAGTPGGPPRQRQGEAGELMPLDVSVVVRGYTCDLCRTFAVDRDPTDDQLEAHRLVMQAMAHVERTVRPGITCKEIYQQVFEMLDGQHGWKFFHHLGHGIGLAPHESPRLNPHFDDVFEIGDVFTAEPGLYGEPLRAGIRIEHNFVVTTDGVERLSHYPTEL